MIPENVLAELRVVLLDGGRIEFRCPPDEMLARAMISKALALLEETLRQQTPRVMAASQFPNISGRAPI